MLLNRSKYSYQKPALLTENEKNLVYELEVISTKSERIDRSKNSKVTSSQNFQIWQLTSLSLRKQPITNFVAQCSFSTSWTII